jgi:diamine N-acetyltransferase
MVEDSVIFLRINVDKAHEIRDLAYIIFTETYQNLLAETQIQYMLDMMYSRQSLEQQWADGCSFFLVQKNNLNIGYGSYSISNGLATIHKLYVDRAYQGQGIGAAFFLFLLQKAKAFGATSLQLYVKRDNPARFFYLKQGMTISHKIDKEIGKGYWMRDFVMTMAI